MKTYTHNYNLELENAGSAKTGLIAKCIEIIKYKGKEEKWVFDVYTRPIRFTHPKFG